MLVKGGPKKGAIRVSDKVFVRGYAENTRFVSLLLLFLNLRFDLLLFRTLYIIIVNLRFFLIALAVIEHLNLKTRIPHCPKPQI